MGWIIGINIFSLAVTVFLRIVLRNEIKKKAWKKHATGRCVFDWFLWSFQNEQGRKPFVWAHLILTISNGISLLVSLLLGMLGIREIVLLPFAMAIFSVLALLWTLALRAKRIPAQDTTYHHVSDGLVLILFTVLCVALLIILAIGMFRTILK